MKTYRGAGAALAVVGLLWSGVIEAVAGPPPKIDIVVLKNKSTGKDGTDYDNVKSTFRCQAEIQNKEFRIAFTNLTVEMYVFGQEVTTKSLKLIDRSTANVASLPPKNKAIVSGSDITLQYDENEVARFGTKYGGYLVVVKDASGAIIASKAAKSSMLKNYDIIRNTQINSTVKD